MSDARLRGLERRWRETNAPLDGARYLLEAIRAGRLARARVELAAWLGHPAARLVPGPRTRETRELLQAAHERGCFAVSQAPVEGRAELIELAVREYLGLDADDWMARHRMAPGGNLEGLELLVEWPGVPPLSLCPVCRGEPGLERWVGALARWGEGAARRAALALGPFTRSLEPGHGRPGVLPDSAQLERDLEALRAWVACPCAEHDRPLVGAAWLLDAACGRLARRILLRRGGEGAMREAIRAAVLPWALQG